MSQGMIEIKGEMSMLYSLNIYGDNMTEVLSAIREKFSAAGKLFENAPFVIDCGTLGEACQNIDFDKLKDLLNGYGCTLVGLRNIPESFIDQAKQAGWSILRASKEAIDPQQIEREGKSLELVSSPLRSGQQVYASNGDVVVLRQTGAGSEILAAGSVHVYGVLRGRVLAGIHGDENARIFCQGLDAELVSIAGCYQLIDDLDEEFRKEIKKKPTIVRFDNGRLAFESFP